MIERYLIQSPLAHLGLGSRTGARAEDAGVAMAEQPFFGIVNLRGPRADEAFQSAFKGFVGHDLPAAAGESLQGPRTTAFWLGPDEWWIADKRGEPGAGTRLAAELRQALAGMPVAVTDISDSRAVIRLSGPRARQVLQKACPLDLHPQHFGAGQCAHTRLAKATALIHVSAEESAPDQFGPGGPAFDIYVVRSFAEYVWHWLESAGQEYGVAVVPA
jgi:sarcosine oxidase subunit gamma